MSLPAATVVVTYGPCLPRDEDERIERDFARMEAEFDHAKYTETGMT